MSTSPQRRAIELPRDPLALEGESLSSQELLLLMLDSKLSLHDGDYSVRERNDGSFSFRLTQQGRQSLQDLGKTNWIGTMSNEELLTSEEFHRYVQLKDILTMEAHKDKLEELRGSIFTMPSLRSKTEKGRNINGDKKDEEKTLRRLERKYSTLYLEMREQQGQSTDGKDAVAGYGGRVMEDDADHARDRRLNKQGRKRGRKVIGSALSIVALKALVTGTALLASPVQKPSIQTLNKPTGNKTPELVDRVTSAAGEALKLPIVPSASIEIQPAVTGEKALPETGGPGAGTEAASGGNTAKNNPIVNVVFNDSPWSIAEKAYGDGTLYPAVTSTLIPGGKVTLPPIEKARAITTEATKMQPVGSVEHTMAVTSDTQTPPTSVFDATHSRQSKTETGQQTQSAQPASETPATASAITAENSATQTEHVHAPTGGTIAGLASGYSRDGCLGCSPDEIMANGQRLDDNRLTVAMNNVPLGTMVKVYNPATGESVVAEVSDIGGFGALGRIADLTPAVRNAIGFNNAAGVNEVEITPES